MRIILSSKPFEVGCLKQYILNYNLPRPFILLLFFFIEFLHSSYLSILVCILFPLPPEAASITFRDCWWTINRCQSRTGNFQQFVVSPSCHNVSAFGVSVGLSQVDGVKSNYGCLYRRDVPRARDARASDDGSRICTAFRSLVRS